MTKGSIADIYFEPIDLGWHFKQLDTIVSGSFFAPTGPYNADAKVNVGSGNWAGLLGLGGILYADPERTWSLSMYTHYELYASQNGRPYTLGDEVPFEWGAGKTLKLPSNIFKEVTLGAVGYAQWQTTDNQVSVSATTPEESTVIHRLEETNMQVYAAGFALQLLNQVRSFRFALLRRVRHRRNTVWPSTDVQRHSCRQPLELTSVVREIERVISDGACA